MKLKGRPEYILLRTIGVERTKAQIYHYRAKRDYLEGIWGVHYSFGKGDRNYAHDVALSSPGEMVEVEQEVFRSIVEWGKGDIYNMYQEALIKYDEALGVIEDGEYKDLPKEELQDLIYGISAGLPKGKRNCSCRRKV